MTTELGFPPVHADPLAPAKLGPISLRNRVIKAATFEGLTPKGLVSDELIEFHRRPAAGGVGMTTVAYCAVSYEGRTSPAQIYWRDEAMPGLRRLTDAIHDEGAAVSAQIVEVNFYPTWTVPESIAKADLIPKLQKDPSYFVNEHFSVLAKGGSVDPHSIDWTRPEVVNYRFVQDPGSFNALGVVRINMPNTDGV